MGRAIVRRPSLFLFDEPLSNLDAALRSQVRVDIRKLHDRLNATSVYVTHDQVEAMTLADVLFVLNRGVVEQAGAPLEIYAHPATQFVASFLGSPAMNFLPAKIAERDGKLFATGKGGLEVPLPAESFGGSAKPGDEVTLGVRPHDVELAPDGAGAKLDVSIVEALGAESYAHGTIGDAPFIARVDAASGVKKGESVHVALENVHLFDPKSGASLRAAKA